MSEIIILLVFLFFACMGVATFTAKLWLMLIRPKTKSRSFSVVKLKKSENREVLNYYVEKYRWYGADYTDFLIFVYDEKPDEAVYKLIGNYKNMTVCTENELSNYIN